MSLLQFKTVTLCDKSWVDPIVMAENSPSADYNFGNIYLSAMNWGLSYGYA